MNKIDIDDEIFEYLQKKAKPFVDTPNTVLRRVLGFSNKSPFTKKEKIDMSFQASKTTTSPMSSSEFVQIVLKKEFMEKFRIKSPYRLLFESDNTLIYFQNFNKESATLWYRINERPFKALRFSKKKCFLCLTNPEERIAYLVPLEEIEKRIITSGWGREYLEINIDHVSHKWKELEWNIEEFLKMYR